MRDNLDLQELRERATYYRNQTHRIRNRSLILMLGIFIVMGWLYVQVKDPIGILYTNNNEEEWHKVTNSVPVDMQVEPDGTLWIQTLFSHRMIQLSQFDWREFDGSEMCKWCFEFDGNFEIYNGNIWAQHKNNLAVFTGGDWLLNEDYFPQHQIQDIGFNNQGRFLIDSSNVVYTDVSYQGWNQARKTLFSGQNSESPSFISTDEFMYLHFDGLYKFDGERWTGLMNLPGDSLFVGFTNDNIWVRTDTALIQYDILTDDITSLALEQLDIPIDQQINHVFVDNVGITHLATNDSIYRLEDDIWIFVETFETLYGIDMVGVAPNGQWFIASTNHDLLASSYADTYYQMNALYPAFAPIIVIFVVLYFWFARYNKANVVRTERSRKLISALVTDFEVDEKKVKQASQPVRNLLIRIVLGMVIVIIVEQIIKPMQLSELVSSMISFGAFGVVWIYPMLRKGINFQDQSEEAQRARRAIPRFFMFYILGFLFIYAVDELIALIAPQIGKGSFVPIFLYFGLLLLYYFYLRRRPSGSLPKSLARADYEQALYDFHKQETSSESRINLSAIELYAGQFDDAVKTCITALSELQAANIAYLSASLSNMARAVNGLGRFDEALRLYEAAIIIFPESPIPYQALVSAYSTNEVFPERAIEISHEMMHRLQTSKPTSIITLEGNSIYTLTHALSLANVGKFDAIPRLVEDAKSNYDFNFLPGQAKFHHMHARILITMDRVDEAKLLLEKAIEVDPNGANGKLARKFLNDL